ncbi:glutaredoxin-like protein [Streptomyces sp. NBRC 110611]|nr:glutaredoxin-like protein [Streptomyces sp. NBRC 110611]
MDNRRRTATESWDREALPSSGGNCCGPMCVVFPGRTEWAVSIFDQETELKEHGRMAGTVTMYSTTWCGYCRRLKSQMDREGIAYTEINIEQDPESAAFVEKANGGNQTVPTVLFADGTTLTNPSLAQVKQKVGAA